MALPTTIPTDPFSAIIFGLQMFEALSPAGQAIARAIAGGQTVTGAEEAAAQQETATIMAEARALLPVGHPDRPV